MRVAIVSSFDLDGGASKAAYRLHRGLARAGLNSRMFVQVRGAGVEDVEGASGGIRKSLARLRPHIDHIPAGLLGARLGDFSVNWLPSGIAGRLEAFDPDVIHLHGVHGGYVSVRDISRLRKPVIWTAHDMWPFTGGCHYDQGCARYIEAGCQPCPMTPKAPSVPLAAMRLRAKARAREQAEPTYVSPSRWLADVARRSMVTGGAEVMVIPNGLDLERFRPIDKAAARSLFKLPADKIVLLFGAVNAQSDLRKGFDLLDAALERISQTPWASSVMLCVYGSSRRGEDVLHGMPVVHTGFLHDDESLVALYSAADIFVAPSRQDNLPNTVLEATACGLPSAAFSIGGMSDLVEDGHSGWLSSEVSAEGLFEALSRGLADTETRARASLAARVRAQERFSEITSVDAYASTYVQVMKNEPSSNL